MAGAGNAPLWTGDLGVDDGSRRGVGHLALDVGEEPAADTLLHHHHAQLRPEEMRLINHWKCGTHTSVGMATALHSYYESQSHIKSCHSVHIQADI